MDKAKQGVYIGVFKLTTANSGGLNFWKYVLLYPSVVYDVHTKANFVMSGTELSLWSIAVYVKTVGLC